MTISILELGVLNANAVDDNRSNIQKLAKLHLPHPLKSALRPGSTAYHRPLNVGG
jgi:hypothetical protein